MFSETAQELLENLEGYQYEIFFAHGLPIPDCFEVPLQKALKKNNFTHYFFVEDDMILPDDTLNAMFLMDAPVVTCDYPVDTKGQGVVFQDRESRVVFTGTGCLLVKREVFDKLSTPYFRSDIKWGIKNHGDFLRLTANVMPNLESYGIHDVTFGIKLWQAEIPISVVGNIGQRKLVSLGKAGSNDGAHKIETWTKLRKDVLWKRFKAMEKQPVGKLITVIAKQGTLTVHPDHAKKLIKAGIATKPRRQSVVVDYNEVEL
jgi:hypothetical protein